MTEPGVVAIVVTAGLVAYYLGVEPWWGRSLYRGLAAARPDDPRALVGFARLTVATQIVATVLVLVVVAIDPLSATDVRLRLPTIDDTVRPFVVGAAGGLLIALVAVVVGTLRSKGSLQVAPDAIAAMIPVTGRERGWMAAVSVGAGVSEELVFRGLLLTTLIGLGASPIVAGVVLTCVFGLAHVYQGIGGVVTTTLFGGAMTALALSTDSLLLPIIVHVLVDLRAMLLLRPSTMPRWATA